MALTLVGNPYTRMCDLVLLLPVGVILYNGSRRESAVGRTAAGVLAIGPLCLLADCASWGPPVGVATLIAVLVACFRSAPAAVR